MPFVLGGTFLAALATSLQGAQGLELLLALLGLFFGQDASFADVLLPSVVPGALEFLESNQGTLREERKMLEGINPPPARVKSLNKVPARDIVQTYL